jgi:hypothetical protein
MKVAFREQPGAQLDQVQRELRRALAGVEVARVLEGKAIAATETRIRHGLDSVPSRWRVASQRGPGIIYETRAPDDKFLYLAALTRFGSAVGAPSELFVRNDVYYCAGVDRAAGLGDEPTRVESNGSAAPTAGFDGYVFAYPEVARLDCTVSSLLFYSDAGAQKVWIGIHANSGDGAGNDYPAPTALSYFEYVQPGFIGGAGDRSGPPLSPITLSAGEKFWVCTAIDNNGGKRGYMQSSNYRPVLGFSTPAGLTGDHKNYLGIRTATVVAYAPGVFPAGGVLLPVGNDTVGASGAATALRPSCYFKLDATSSSSGSGAGGASLVADIEVL